jgi:ATP-dependent DNA helicase RecG
MTEQALVLLRRGALTLEELLPDALRGQLSLQPLAATLDYIHRPPPDADVAALGLRNHPAQKRLALEELLAHNLGMRKLRRLQRSRKAPAMPTSSKPESDFIECLSFELTDAQKRVAQEIHQDLGKDRRPLDHQGTGRGEGLPQIDGIGSQ